MPESREEEQAKAEQYRGLLYTTTEETDSLTQQPRLVRTPTPLRQAYDAGKLAYEAAAQRYQALRLDANTTNDPRTVLAFAQNAPLHRQPVQAAMADWLTNGFKNEVEMMEAYIAQVTGSAAASQL
ncbi:hypothetical protein [Hymenobacter psoromatis]|nr:hypothetical protein [Hymenobacter psoromatis]